MSFYDAGRDGMDGSLSHNPHTREAIILAGGLGTRLRPSVADKPKILAPVAGRPFLAHILSVLERNGFSRVVLAVGYKHEQITDAFGERFGEIKLEYSVESEPLGTGGAVWLAARRVTPGQDFFVLNGDTYAMVDFGAMEEAFYGGDTDIAMAVCPMKDCGRYGLVEADAKSRITGFLEKTPGSAGTINAGVYLLRHDLPQRFTFPKAFSLETNLFQEHLDRLRIIAVPMEGYFIDIGIPEDYEKANRELK